MKISYMSRYSQTDMGSSEQIIKFFNILDDTGYDGVLFVYHSTVPDYWIKCARYLNTNHKFKFIIAMRTYAISPEYCNLICRSFNEIQENRLSLNIVAGDLHENETSIDDVVFISDLIDTTEKRVSYTTEWLKKFLHLCKDRPNIIVSGYSEGANKNAEFYADEQLMMLSTYKNLMYNKIKCKGKMVSVPVSIASTNEEAKQHMLNLWGNNDMMMDSSVYGTEDEVIKQIINLSTIGITNVLLSPSEPSQEKDLHKMAKKLIKEINNANL